MLCACVPACLSVCVQHAYRCLWGPKEGTDPLKLEIQMVVSHPVWVLGPKPVSLFKSVSTLKS